MNPTLLRDLVRDAIKSEWPVFAREHPHLAEAIDATVLETQLSIRLSDDPEFQRAMRDAQTLETVSHAVADTVRDYVRRWLVGR